MKWIVRSLYIIFLIKFIFALMPSFQVDMGAWLGWASRLATLPMASFYSDTVWTQYTPGYLYWLWIIGKLGWITPMAIKLPVIIADMLSGYLIWKVVSKANKTWANVAFVIYTLSPVTIIDGSVWGQIDGLLTLFMFGSVYALIEKKNYQLSAFLLAISFLIKPQTMAIVPIIIILTWVRFGFKKLINYGAIVASVVVIGFYPFYPHNAFLGVFELIQKMGVSYSYTSLFAFNIWSLVGMWQPDSLKFWGLTYFSWGTIMMLVVYLATLIKFRKHMNSDKETYLMFAMACFIFFLFPTRVHERYLFPMYAFLITYVGSKQNKSLLLLSVLSIIAYTINLYYPYSSYESLSNPLKSLSAENLIQKIIPYLTTLQLAIFGGLYLFPAGEETKESIPVEVRHGKSIEHGGNQKQTQSKKKE